MPSDYDPTHYQYAPGVSHAATASYAVDQFIPYPQTEPHSGEYELVYSTQGISYYDWLQQKRAETRQRQQRQQQQLLFQRVAAAQRMSASSAAFQDWCVTKQRQLEAAHQHQLMIQQQHQQHESARTAQHMTHKAAVLRAWVSSRNEVFRRQREMSEMSAADASGKQQHLGAVKAQLAEQQYQQWKAKRDRTQQLKREKQHKIRLQQKQQQREEQQKKTARVTAWREQLAKQDADSLTARRAARATAKQAKQQRQQEAEKQYKQWKQRCADARVRSAVMAKLGEWDRSRAARGAKQRAYQRKHVLCAYQHHTRQIKSLNHHDPL